MNQDTLMNKLLDGHIEMKENMAKVVEIVTRHDEETFPKIEKKLEEVDHAIKRIESKQNQDMVYFHQEKEGIISRIKPLEDDYKARKAVADDIKSHIKSMVWKGIEYLVALLVVGLIGQLLLKSNLFQ